MRREARVHILLACVGTIQRMLVKNDVECQYCYKIPHTGRSHINSVFFHSVNFSFIYIVLYMKRKKESERERQERE